MSQPTKITSKNLHYDASLPPFLQRFHAQSSGYEQSRAPAPRPQKPRDADADAEDEPTYVDEENRTLSRAEYETLVSGKDAGTEDVKSSDTAGEALQDNTGREGAVDEENREKEKPGSATIGATRKRKAGRVVGGDDGDDLESLVKAEVRKRDDEVANQTASRADAKKDTAVKKKKGKKIKLSFNEDEE